MDESTEPVPPRPARWRSWGVAFPAGLMVLAGLLASCQSRPGMRDDLGVEFVHVVPGSPPMGGATFLMGSPAGEAGRAEDEVQHRVTLTKDYFLGRYPVTQRQWTAVMGTNPSGFQNQGGDAPVENVSWDDATEFCRRLTARERAAGKLQPGYVYALPTEAQWEYACRAGSTGPYGGNGKLAEMGWYKDNSGGHPHPVGRKDANAWGLHDMHGNVWQWCSDWYDNYPDKDATDPAGPHTDTGQNRVDRGGSWGDEAIYCRSANRGSLDPGYRYHNLGFRVALEPQSNTPSRP